MSNIVPVTLPLVPDLSKGLLSFSEQIQNMYTTLAAALAKGQGWGSNPIYFKAWTSNFSFGPGAAYRANVGLGILSTAQASQTKRQLAIATGWLEGSSSGVSTGMSLVIGTGTPPAQNTHPAVGSSIDGGTLSTQDTVAIFGTGPFTLAGVASVSSTIWYDLVIDVNSSGASTIVKNGTFMLMDV